MISQLKKRDKMYLSTKNLKNKKQNKKLNKKMIESFYIIEKKKSINY